MLSMERAVLLSFSRSKPASIPIGPLAARLILWELCFAPAPQPPELRYLLATRRSTICCVYLPANCDCDAGNYPRYLLAFLSAQEQLAPARFPDSGNSGSPAPYQSGICLSCTSMFSGAK